MQLSPAILLAALWATPAMGTEVIWTSTPSQEDATLVGDQAGATQGALKPIDLRAAATSWSEADDAAYKNLDNTLTQVRAYETKLDGELLIMRDLAGAIARVGLVRDDSDRGKVYAALAYQGFAVNRYFDTTLADAPEAEPYRMDLQGLAIEKPWFDAVALDPTREVTPYDIAEAPQRVAYGIAADMVVSALPASFTPVDLPENGTIFVDGRQATPGSAGNIKLVPGRHLIHVTLRDRVIARWDVRLDPGQALEAGPELKQADWTDFLDGISADSTVPAALGPHLDAFGGEIWIATPTDKRPNVFAVTADGVTAVQIDKPKGAGANEDKGSLSLTVGAASGWFYSGDFFTQAPSADNHTRATVNAVHGQLFASVDMDVSLLRVSAGIDTSYTLGQTHFALTGANSWRVRPYPHVGVGVKLAQVTLGYLMPYHPGVGARITVPLTGPVELRASGLYGLPGERSYPDSIQTYFTQRVTTANLGVGIRL
jgi:hypothetical protein